MTKLDYDEFSLNFDPDVHKLCVCRLDNPSVTKRICDCSGIVRIPRYKLQLLALVDSCNVGYNAVIDALTAVPTHKCQHQSPSTTGKRRCGARHGDAAAKSSARDRATLHRASALSGGE